MVRAAALGVLLIAAPVVTQTDSAWLNWVTANAPHGFDFTPDGTIWINLSEPGEKDDYAIRAEDLQQARLNRTNQPKFWVRGYHVRNKAVAYRESKTRFSIDCKNETLARLTAAYYKGDEMIAQDPYQSMGYIIPGTYGAEYFRLICLVS